VPRCLSSPPILFLYVPAVPLRLQPTVPSIVFPMDLASRLPKFVDRTVLAPRRLAPYGAARLERPRFSVARTPVASGQARFG